MGEVDRRLPVSVRRTVLGSREGGVSRAVPAVDVSTKPITVYVGNPPRDENSRARELYIDLLAQVRRQARLNGISITEDDIAQGIGVETTVFTDFKRGLTADPELGLVVEGLRQHVGRKNETLKALENIARRRGQLQEIDTARDAAEAAEELRLEQRREIEREKQELQQLEKEVAGNEEVHQWVWHLWKKKEPITAGQGVRILRTSRGESQVTFGGDSISEDTLSHIETGKTQPRLATINSAISYTHLEKTHPLIAQLLRLSTAGIPPQSTEAFSQETRGKILRNLRIQRGYTLEDLAIRCERSIPWVAKLENDKNINFTEDTIRRIFEGIEAPAVFIDFMVARQEDPALTMPFEVRKALLGTFFFTDFFQEMKNPFIEQEKLNAELAATNNFAAALALLRARSGLRQEDLRQQPQVSRAEVGTDVPEDFVIAQYLSVLGYKAIDPVAQTMFQLAAQERAIREADKHGVRKT
jgi:transcriptional regulator with XRE-family HTH domain